MKHESNEPQLKETDWTEGGLHKQQECGGGGSRRAIHRCLAQFRRDLSQNVEKNGVKMGNDESPKSRTLSFTNFETTIV